MCAVLGLYIIYDVTYIGMCKLSAILASCLYTASLYVSLIANVKRKLLVNNLSTCVKAVTVTCFHTAITNALLFSTTVCSTLSIDCVSLCLSCLDDYYTAVPSLIIIDFIS